MHRSLIFILAGVVVVMSITAASYLVLTKFSPQRELRLMLTAMSRLTSVSQTSGFSWTRTDGENRSTTTLYTSSQLDLHDPSAIDHQTTFRTVRVDPSNTYTDLAGEVRTVDGVTYLTYQPPAPTIPGIDFNATSTWVSFQSGELRSWGSLIPELEPPIELSFTSSVWTPEGIKRLRALLAIADVFLVSYDDVTEVIDGADTRVIDAWLDPSALRAFLFSVVRAKEGRDPTDEERIAAEMQARQLERLTLRLWIGEKDHLLYRVQAAGGFVNEDSTNLIPVDVRIDVRDRNALVVIEAPKKSMSFATLLRGALLPSQNGKLFSNQTFVNEKTAQLPVQRVEVSDDPDDDGLNNLLEMFYGTKAHRADTDGDGMNDGEEVSSGRNPRGKGTLFGFGL